MNFLKDLLTNEDEFETLFMKGCENMNSEQQMKLFERKQEIIVERNRFEFDIEDPIFFLREPVII